jgi:predicted anti-sigma-YlaC factor YlaD
VRKAASGSKDNILHLLAPVLRLSVRARSLGRRDAVLGPRRPIVLKSCRLGVVAVLLPLLGGCAMLKHKAVGMVADTLASSGDVFTRDDDLELVGQAIPFGLKLYESLLDSAPRNKDLLIATCSNFTQYGVAFLETEALVLGEAAHHDEVAHLNGRALKIYLRAKGYCLRAMDVRFPGISEKLVKDPAAALKDAKKQDVPLLYWMAASWGSAIGLGIDKPELVIDLPVVRALAERALALDETWSKGALHEMFVSLDSQPEALGGSVERARAHFKRAVELQGGASPGPYVSLAVGVAAPAQDRAEFESLLKQALAIDPEKNPSTRLVTLVQQRRAQALLDHIDTLFTK